MGPGVSACWGGRLAVSPAPWCPGAPAPWHTVGRRRSVARPTRCPAQGFDHHPQLNSTGTEPRVRSQPCPVSKPLSLLSSDLISSVCQPCPTSEGHLAAGAPPLKRELGWIWTRATGQQCDAGPAAVAKTSKSTSCPALPRPAHTWHQVTRGSSFRGGGTWQNSEG